MELYYLDAETQLAKYVFCKNSLTFPHTLLCNCSAVSKVNKILVKCTITICVAVIRKILNQYFMLFIFP